ncbi:BON domain-containing protein [Cupriavidus sp. BIS7]|uniref:BON domain-containing protein n=1 Tax=Cupriavidus sp. BIS7 TaxID=1217718 RepID=UPI00037C717B|nr:BON domain-containing protein [Cupriavidus sp. BIS7]
MEPVKRLLSDSAITMKVRVEMFAAKGLNSTGIKVSTNNGVVHLGGKVKDDNDHLAALKAAISVTGVNTVEDEIQVGG